MDIFRQAGDAHIGQTLVRLARLAEAAHRHEQASTLNRMDWKAGRPSHGSEADRHAEANVQAATLDDSPSARTEDR